MNIRPLYDRIMVKRIEEQEAHDEHLQDDGYQDRTAKNQQLRNRPPNALVLRPSLEDIGHLVHTGLRCSHRSQRGKRPGPPLLPRAEHGFNSTIMMMTKPRTAGWVALQGQDGSEMTAAAMGAKASASLN